MFLHPLPTVMVASSLTVMLAIIVAVGLVACWLFDMGRHQ